MAITYIAGRSGSGRTTRLHKEVKRMAEEGRNVFVIVPDQYTLEAERDLFAALDTNSLLTVEVLSFPRLAERVISACGPRVRRRIDSHGLSMLVRSVLGKNETELPALGRAGKQGLSQLIANEIAVFKQCRVTPELLLDAAYHMKDAFKNRLVDLAFVYRKTEELALGRYMDSQDALSLLAQNLKESGLMNNACVCIDGFETFTPQMETVMRAVVEEADVFVTLCLDPLPGRDSALFGPEQKIYDALHNMAASLLLEEHFLPLCAKREGALAHLEANLYALPTQKYTQETTQLQILEAAEPISEAERVCAQIQSLARRGMRYKDMAVALCDLDTYAPFIKRAMARHGIPCFLDAKRTVSHHPLALLCSAALGCAEKITRTGVIQVMKTGLSGLSADEVQRLENEILKRGLQGKKLLLPLRDPAMESCRQVLMEPLEALISETGKKNTVESLARALYAYLCRLDAAGQIEQMAEALAGEGRPEESKEYMQVFNAFTGLLDQAVLLLGSEEMTHAEFGSMLQSGFDSLEVGIIPTTIDQVSVGDVSRSKARRIKALFVLGCNEGSLPSSPPEGLLSVEDMEALENAGLNMGHGGRERSARENLNIYRVLTKPREFLQLSYALTTMNGAPMLESVIIKTVNNIFPNVQTITEASLDESDYVTTPAASFTHLVQAMRGGMDGKKYDPVWQSVYGWYAKDPLWQTRLQNAKTALTKTNRALPLLPEQAKSLYGSSAATSISRVEQFNRCPYLHFVQYGLRPLKRAEFEVERLDIGTIYHSAIERFMKENGGMLKDMPDEQCKNQLYDSIKSAIDMHEDGLFSSTARNRMLTKRLCSAGAKSLWVMVDHLKKSDFSPVYNELVFGQEGGFPPIEVTLADGSKAYIRGKIDRVDCMEKNGDTYVRIIDYKSGEKDFSYAQLYNGTQLQLLVYMKAVLNHIKNARPAGLFYFTLKDPYVQSDSQIREEVEKLLQKELRMEGLLLNDVEIVRAMDHRLGEGMQLIPAAAANGGIRQADNLLSTQQMEQAMDYAAQKTADTLQRIMEGANEILPLREGRHLPCSWCEYRPVCGFDIRLGNMWRPSGAMRCHEFYERISGDETVDA
ncbi:MAG: PD-(D/E)XK nuclease family protein [Christensenellales bacterium]